MLEPPSSERWAWEALLEGRRARPVALLNEIGGADEDYESKQSQSD